MAKQNDIQPAGSFPPLSISSFKKLVAEDVLVLDTRPATEFKKAFIPGSMFIGIEGSLKEWSLTLIPIDQPLLLVIEPGKEADVIAILSSAGYNMITGFLKGGFATWKDAGEPVDMVIDVPADELALDLPFDENLTVLDVRNPVEFADGHVKGAINLPLSDMSDIVTIAQIEETQNHYIHSLSGYRSVIAVSILKREGYHNLRNVEGGWLKIKQEHTIPTEKDLKVLN
jgi:rhodanese-related sulfurtransferase